MTPNGCFGVREAQNDGNNLKRNEWSYSNLQKMFRDKGLMNCCANNGKAYQPCDIEQRANIFTHFVNIIPAFVAVHDMYRRSFTFLDYLCSAVYGTSLVLLFSISTIFHIISLVPSLRLSRLRHIFHLGDRLMIYIFISASYMPWMLLQPLSNAENVVMAIWTLAGAGIVYSLLMHERYKTLETAIYLCQGFLPAFFLMKETTTSMFELALGGLLYVVGVLFFKLDGKIPFAHAIWHCLGSFGAWVHHYGIWVHFYAHKLPRL